MFLRILRLVSLYALRVFLFFVGIVIFYLLLALILAFVPVNADSKQPEAGITMYLSSNGVHTDLIVPIDSGSRNWLELFPARHLRNPDRSYSYIGFGWGDKGFYLNTPTWNDLTVATVCKAVFIPSATTLHVSYFGSATATDRQCKKIVLSRAQYEKIAEFIRNSLALDQSGDPILITGEHYHCCDAFYEARGKYSFLYTCNNWTNEALKRAGVRTALWAPFDRAILAYF